MADELNLDGMTDEQILALIKSTEKPGGKPKQKVKVQLINGDVLEADTAEDLNQVLAQRLAAAQNKIDEVEEPIQPSNTTVNQPRLPKFDYQKFEQTFVKDPVAGQEYLETTQYGVPLKQLLTQMAGALSTSMKKLQELEAQQFIDQNPEYEPSVENRKAIDKVMTERNWQPSRQTLEDAFAIASAKGTIKAKGGKTGRTSEPESEQFIPPRTRGASEETNSDQQLLASLNNLSDEQIFEAAQKFGIARKR